MSEFEKIIANIRSLSLDQKAYLAELLLKDIDANKKESNVIAGKRNYGEYIGKITR